MGAWEVNSFSRSGSVLIGFYSLRPKQLIHTQARDSNALLIFAPSFEKEAHSSLRSDTEHDINLKLLAVLPTWRKSA